MEKALITGITGQDGSYLAELLLDKGYDVYGVVRRSSTINTTRIDHLLEPVEKVKLIYGDLADGIDHILYDVQPDLIFNTAAMSHVRVSFDIPVYTLDINAIGPTRILEGIRKMGLVNKTRFIQTSSSEMFGMSPPIQDENTPFLPCSPYGIAKLAAYWMVRTYRDGYKMFACNSICLNHESSRRGETFVTKKVVRAAVRIKLGTQKRLVLGNLSAKRDWGHSKDYMTALYKIITHDTPDDFVIATGEHYSVEDFVRMVFAYLDMDYKDYVDYDSRYTRPKEVPDLCGSPAKIKRVLGWEPKVTVVDLIDEMVSSAMDEETGKEKKC